MKFIVLFAVFLLVIMSMQGCAVQKQLVPIGGSRADGTVKLAYEYGMFEKPQVDGQQALNSARQSCGVWGYTDAQPFGSYLTNCVSMTQSGCNRWRVTVEYQCVGTGNPPASK